MRRCVLCKSEVDALRWEWFSNHGEKGIWLELIRRPIDRRERPRGAGRARPRRDARPANSRIPGWPTATRRTRSPGADRWEGCARRVNEYVRRHLPDRHKGAYELCKQWGSEMAKDWGIERASRMMGHGQLSTTWPTTSTC